MGIEGCGILDQLEISQRHDTFERGLLRKVPQATTLLYISSLQTHLTIHRLSPPTLFSPHPYGLPYRRELELSRIEAAGPRFLRRQRTMLEVRTVSRDGISVPRAPLCRPVPRYCLARFLSISCSEAIQCHREDPIKRARPVANVARTVSPQAAL